MARIRIKLDIRTVRDAEAARKLFYYYLYNGNLYQARDVAKNLVSAGFEEWIKEVDLLDTQIRHG